MAIKRKSNRIFREGKKSISTKELAGALDQTFSGSASLITYFTNNSSAKITTTPNFLNDGNANTASYNYPKLFFRGNPNKTIKAFGVGYGSGVIFWATDSNNWWAATIDVDNSQSYDVQAVYGCTAYTCTGYTCAGYSWAYIASRMQYRQICSAGFYCSSSTCSTYGTTGYQNVNYRYNGMLKIIRSIAGSISTVTSSLWNQTTLSNVSVEFDGNGNATARGYNSSDANVVSVSFSGGSGKLYGIVGSPIINGNYSPTARISRLTVSA